MVGAVQDAQLAGAGLAGPVGAPGGEPVGGAGSLAVTEQGGDGGHQTASDRLHEYVVTDAVELEEDHAGGGRARARLQLAPPSVGEPVEPASVRVVVPDGECTTGGGGDGRHHRGDHHGRLRGGLALSRRDDAQGEPQERAVEEEDEQAEDEGGDEEQGPDEERPDDGGEDAERPGAECGRDGDLRRAVPVGGLDSEVRQDPGQRQHGDRGHGPYGNAPPERAHQPPPSRAAHATPTSTPLSDLPQPCHKHASRFGGARGHDGCSHAHTG